MKKNRVVRLMITVITIMVLMMGFTGCAKKRTCELCQEKKVCKKYTIEGESGYLCKSCHKGLESLQNLLD